MQADLSCVADDFHITEVCTACDLQAVRDLCWAYRDYLLTFAPAERDITETFYPVAAYQKLMDNLAEAHARPQGLILLARSGVTPVGCGMSHGLNAQTCEIKRVFVTKEARNRGIARALCQQLMNQARTDGFSRVVLDTSAAFVAARHLYASLGFTGRGPYQPTPERLIPQLAFFEAQL